MIAGESLGNAGKLLALQLAQELLHLAGAENAPEFLVVFGDVVANGQQGGWFRHVDAAADGDLLMRDREVVARVAMVYGNTAMKAGGNVGLVWRLVLAEPSVAVNAVDRLARFGDVLGSELHEGCVYSLHERLHRLLHSLFK